MINLNVYVYKGRGAGSISTDELIRSLRQERVLPIEADFSYWSRFDTISSVNSLIIGGGHGTTIGTEISSRGIQERIRNWLEERDHSFVGICAGAIVASSQWSQGPRFNRWESASNCFPLQLYPGNTYGPGHLGEGFPDAVKSDPFITARAVDIFRQGSENPTAMYWNLGPHFDPDYREQQVIASYTANRPAVVQLPYGHGQVILSGVHPEIRATPDCHPQIQQVARTYSALTEDANIQAQSALFREICSRAGIISDKFPHLS